MISYRLIQRNLLAAAIAAALSPVALATDFVWLAGNYGPAIGPNPLPPGDLLLGQEAGAKNFVAIDFANQGTVAWQTTSRIGFVSSTVTNSGLWDLQADANLSYAGGGASNFINSGIFRKSAGAGSTLIDLGIHFINSGIVDAQSGLIDFAGGSASFAAGTQFTGTGINRISHNASFSGAFTSANLALAAGNFAGDNTTPAVLGGSVRWTGGQFTGSWQVGSGQTLTAQDGAAKNFNATGFTNLGTLAWQGSDRIGFVSANVTNQGLWDLQADANLNYAGGGSSNLVNNGTFRKSAGGGSAVIDLGLAFINNGVVDAASGTIDFASGSALFNAGTQFTGPGINRVSHNASFAGAFTSTNLALAAGSFAGDNITPAVLGGSVRWTGGQFTGTWLVGSGQTLTAQDGADKNFNATTFTNSGTLAWQGTDRIGFISASVTNQGLWDLQADANLSYAGGGSSNLINNGVFRKSAGSGSATIGGGVVFLNSGVIDAQSGLIDFAGGSASFAAGTQFIGAGINRISSNASFAGAFTSANLALAAGNFAGDNTTPAVLGGSVRWTGGQFTGSWLVGGGQTLTAQDGGDKNFNASNFTNLGTLAWQGTGRIGFVSSSVTNQGLWDLQADVDFKYAGGGSSNLLNLGSLRKSAGSGSSTIGGGVVFINSGVIDAQSGTIDFAGGSALFHAGTQFTGAGINRISHNASFAGAFTSTNLALAAGNFAGDNANPAVLGGSVRWTGGQFTGTWQVGSGQTLTAQDGADKNFNATSFTNSGTLAWQSANRVGFISATVVNDGLFDLQADADLSHAGGGSSLFVNNGVLRKSAGTGTSAIGIGVAFSNPGTIEALSGNLQLPDGFGNAGTIRGTASVQTNLLTNAGHVAPGAAEGTAPATLTVDGSFAQAAAGVFDIDVGTPASSDRLVVTGSATLEGALALHCYAACSFAVGEKVLILDASGTLVGSFANPPTLSGFASGQFAVDYDRANSDVWLRATETVTAVPEPGSWLLMLGGLAALARRASPRGA